MVNGLGVVGWGVGGIEAEACMLGQPISMLIPEVLGVRLVDDLPEGATATDLVLTVTETLRKLGVVGKFVEFYGPGLASLTIADRATLGNMSPEYGATIAIFPVDEMTLDYLRLTGRPDDQVALVERYTKEQGLFRTRGAARRELRADDRDRPRVDRAEPRRPAPPAGSRHAEAGQAEVPAGAGEDAGRAAQERAGAGSQPVGRGGHVRAAAAASSGAAVAEAEDSAASGMDHGAVVVAAITSCTNTSNPSVMIGAGLLAKKAVEKGLTRKPWVKTSLAPGSQVVTAYLDKAGLTPYLEQLGFNLVGYGCTTCIGNSGPLPEEIGNAIEDRNLVVASVLSGNRNFEGRIQPLVRANYLASPPLVVAYAIAGQMTIDLTSDPIGKDQNGQNVYLRDIWPTEREIQESMLGAVQSSMFREKYADVFKGDHRWQAIAVPEGERFAWEGDSTYVRLPPYFDGMTMTPAPLADVTDARVLAVLGDSVTTDHISPAGSIKKDSPAGRYLIEHGVQPSDFNSYGARRGNHEVMVRGTFANIRLRNQLAAGTEGGFTTYLPTAGVSPKDAACRNEELMTIYDASMRYQEEGVPLVIFAGKEYGSGSSRDWAAKGTKLLGVRAVIAESFERIHRSNLVNMGVLPLQYLAGATFASLKLTGRELVTITGVGGDA